MRLAMVALLSAVCLSAAWPNGYSYQATFTVQTSQVTGTLTSFPALDSRTVADFKTVANGGQVINTCTQTIGNRSLTVPCDLIFTSDSAGTSLLSWEWETYSATTGAYNVWLNVPSITTGTVVYAWYGKASVITLQTTPTSVWTGYTAVYHLPEDPSGSAPQLNDSTANVNHGTTAGTMTSGEQVAGQVDGSVSFNGSTQYAALANAANFAFERTDSWSCEAWVKSASNVGGYVVTKLTGLGGFTGWACGQRVGITNPQYQFIADNSLANRVNTRTTAEFAFNTWHHVVWTYSGNSNTSGVAIYVDGAVQAKTDIANTLSSSILTATGPEIAAADTTPPNTPYSGVLDEIRLIKNTVLTAGYVASAYKNQFSPAAFWGVTSGNVPTVVAPGGGGFLLIGSLRKIIGGFAR